MGVVSCGTTMLDQGVFENLPVATWDTTPKTSGFTAVSGVGYFVNTTAGAISVNLPAGTAGAVVAIKDYANTFDTNACTLVQNGSDKIGGSTNNSILSTEGIAVTLVYVDATQGWLVTGSGLQSEAPLPQYITATGGTITCSGDYKIHTFTGPGTFCVSCAGNPAGSVLVDYMVVAGGGAGGDAGDRGSGGGGAGGYRESPGTASGSYTVSPLGVAPAVALPVSVTGYPITVGAGGAGVACNPQNAGPGANSVFSTITAYGGGGGGQCDGASPLGKSGAPGGSGGGAGIAGPSGGSIGNGNTPPVLPPQGNNGGASGGGCSSNSAGGGGGGATAVGVNAGPGNAGDGGAGATSSINGTPTARAGGGGAGGGNSFGNGVDGGGNGNTWPGSPGPVAPSGTTNTGGGGGGSSANAGGGNGGSGIVVIRYKFQN